MACPIRVSLGEHYTGALRPDHRRRGRRGFAAVCKGILDLGLILTHVDWRVQSDGTPALRLQVTHLR